MIKYEDKVRIKLKRCKYCKGKENLTVDHKIPIIKGGSDDLKNLQCLCRRCNAMKSALTDGQVRGYFKWFLMVQEDRKNNGSNPYKIR